MIKGAVALGLTAAIPICAKAADNQFNQEPQEQDTDKENNEEYHLYSLIPSETVPFDGTLRPAPMFVNWSNHSEDLDEINDIGFRFVVWATAEQATALNESDQIESLSMIEQDSVTVLGQPENANGKLTVRLFPNAAIQQAQDESYETVTKIAAQWRQELDNVQGITITTPGASNKIPDGEQRKALPPQAFNIPPQSQGQIVIAFEGELDETVLDKVTSHPQTLLIQWGAIIPPEICNCPGCGMG